MWNRESGGVLNGGEGGGRGGGDSINEKIFLVFKEEDSGQDSVSAFLFTRIIVCAGTQSRLVLIGDGGGDGSGVLNGGGDGGGVLIGVVLGDGGGSGG